MGDELEDELDGFGDFVSDSLHDTTLINDGNYSANFTTSKSISALKETADSILYVAQLIEKAEKEADAARNSSEAAVAQTRAEEAMDVVNQLEAAVSDWKDWNDDRQKKKIIVRTPKEILEIAAAVMKVENAVRGAKRAYRSITFRVSSLASAEADVAAARAAAADAKLAVAEAEARLAEIDARAAEIEARAAEAMVRDIPLIHSAKKHASRRLDNVRKRAEQRLANLDLKRSAGIASKKKRKRKHNKTKSKWYKKQIKRYTKKYCMRN